MWDEYGHRLGSLRDPGRPLGVLRDPDPVLDHGRARGRCPGYVRVRVRAPVEGEWAAFAVLLTGHAHLVLVLSSVWAGGLFGLV